MGLLPFYMLKSSITNTVSFLTSFWAKLFYSEPELRRSRRLRGLNPEQLALQERERKRRINQMKGESSFISDQEEDEMDNIENASESPKTNVSKRLTNKKASKRMSIFEWFVSLFYKQKQVRRSRRLQGLRPEQVKIMEKRRRQQRKQKAGINEGVSNEEDFNEELSICDDDLDEESEFIFSAYFYSFSEYLSQILSWGQRSTETKELEKTVGKSTKESVSEDIAEQKNEKKE